MSDSQSVFEASVKEFLDKCTQNFLELNVGKSKEMVVGFKRDRTDVAPLVIGGQTVERVQEYRYLGTVIDDKFTFNKNTAIIHKKCRQRMVIFYQLRSLMVSNKILTQCYHAYVESILTFSFICWFGSLNVKDKQILNNITKQCSKITGKSMVNLTELYRKRVISKALKIEQDPSHCLHMVLEWLPSKKRMRAIRCATNRFKNTFFPTAIRFINENNSD